MGVLGEATSLDIYLGHRGRAEIEMFSKGKMSHSSAPWLGINAVSKMLPVLSDIEKLTETMPDDKVLGASTQVITHISCQPGWGSTLPDICKVIIDRRYIPTESSASALAQIQEIIDQHMKADPDTNITAGIRTMRHTSYTGIVKDEFMDKPAYYVPPENTYVVKTVEALKEIGQNPAFGKWNFGTDGAYTAHDLNIPTIGYSCCEEIYAHRPTDRVNIDFMIKCAAGSCAIAAAVAK
ncbi:Acetylornithine deacetylase [bioreactor metagenome]|uniref:Acetylornithine deacetylase n=1 Tax=bioreactor metagenome TaxID=1076179 RepID=A0A645E565_9ZZZZ